MGLPRRSSLLVLLLGLAVTSCADPVGMNPTRRASRLDVTGGADQLGAALQALPQAISVRLLDVEGRPIADAQIVWEVTEGGGHVDPSTIRTDTDGRAEAVWTLGATFGTQRVVARHGEVRKSFEAEVPISSMALSLLEERHWKGDTVSISLVVEDAQGTPLTGDVTWRVSEPQILWLGPNNTVIAQGLGPSWVVADLGVAKDSVHVEVLPTVVGRIIPIGPTVDASSAEVTVSFGDSVLPVDVGGDGEFTVRLTAPLEEVATLEVTPGADSTHFPVLMPLDPSYVDEVVPVVLIPPKWTIEGGRHQGTEIRFSLNVLMTKLFGSTFEYWPATITEEGHSGSWFPEPLPIPVTIRHSWSWPTLRTADSVALWQTLETIEDEAGLDLFEPVVEDTAATGRGMHVSASRDVWYQWTMSASYGSQGWNFDVSDWQGGTATWAAEREGRVNWTTVRVNDANYFRNPGFFRAVTIWALGVSIGHDPRRRQSWCLFPSFRADCHRFRRTEFSPEDVAALQLHRAVAEAVSEVRTWRRTAVPIAMPSLYGERARWLGLEPVPWEPQSALPMAVESALGDGPWLRFARKDQAGRLTGGSVRCPPDPSGAPPRPDRDTQDRWVPSCGRAPTSR